MGIHAVTLGLSGRVLDLDSRPNIQVHLRIWATQSQSSFFKAPGKAIFEAPLDLLQDLWVNGPVFSCAVLTIVYWRPLLNAGFAIFVWALIFGVVFNTQAILQ